MKLKGFLLTLMSIISFYGCTKHDLSHEGKDDSHQEGVRVHAGFADNTLSDKWTERDNIGISTVRQTNLCYSAGSSGESTYFSAANLHLIANEGDHVYAYYPYKTDRSVDNNLVSIRNIHSQYYSKTLSEYDILCAKGKVVDNEVAFKFEHIYSYLRITIPTDKLIQDEQSGNYIIQMVSNESISIFDGNYNIETKEFETRHAEDMVFILDEGIDGKENITFTVAILPQSSASHIYIYIFANNYSVRKFLYNLNAPEDGFQAGKLYDLTITDEILDAEKEKSVEALKALYDSTNGDKWFNSSNWLSDEPLYTWHGINTDNWEDTINQTDDIVEILLSDNNLRGTLPVEFAHIMSKAINIQLDRNSLYGIIPEEIRTHNRWAEFGWNIILQDPYFGGGFDMTDINLQASDMEVEYLKGGTTRLSELLKANKLSLIMIDTPSDELANLFLSYKNKGFGIIINHSGMMGESREATIERTDKYPITDRLVRIWEMEHPELGMGLSIIGTVYILDENGSLIDVLIRNWSLPESWYCNKISEILRKYLGEPEEHPDYSTEYYTSTDYSRDGEVVTLQTATKGKGIDLVFIGDGYVDKQMDVDGKYERDMRTSMEYFFEVEPYKSFRNRFNVYAVKVISPNEEQAEGCQWRLNYNDNLCFEYASKVPGVNIDKATVVNVTNNPNLFYISGHTNMYIGGASVAHIEQGGPSSIIVHEAGGHGFGKLLDEYIYGGYEDNICPPENLESFKEWIRTEYHNRGWGLNIDTTDDPEKVIWSHFLKDVRYNKEVGIWQGAWLWPTDLWRSSENSVMNTDYSYFNAPSRETIYKWIMEWSEGEGWEYDYEKFVEYDVINRNTVQTRSNYVDKRDDRKIIHHAPNIIKGSPCKSAKP